MTISALLDQIQGEDGCRAYRFYGEVGDQNSLLLIAEWDTQAAWENHLNSESFAVLIGSLRLLSNHSNLDFSLLSPVTGIEAGARFEQACEQSLEAPQPDLY